MEHTNDDITTLGAKLDGLDLSAGERSVLDAVLAREDDAVGHGDSGFGLKIGRLFDTMADTNPYFEGPGNQTFRDPISNGDLGSGRRDA